MIVTNSHIDSVQSIDSILEEEIKTIKSLIHNDLFKLRKTSETRNKIPRVADQYLLTLAIAELKIVEELVEVEMFNSHHWKNKKLRLEHLIEKLTAKIE